ncbi:MAG: MFS transporter [Actinomycetota bacterium]|nr:MFS transporter [Actinomycetota bacterium]
MSGHWPRYLPVGLLELANLASGVGNAIVMITIPWFVLDLTGSAAAAGLVAAVSAIPSLLVSPIAGWLVDRFGRRVISVASDVMSALSVAAIPVVALAGDLTLPLIIALALVGAAFDPAGYTARRALIPDAAMAARMPVDRLNGIHEGVFAVGWTIGPLLAAVLIAAFGAAPSFWAPFGLFLLASACVAVMRVRDQGQQERQRAIAAGEHVGGWQGLVRGFSVLWHDRLLRTITIAVVVLVAIYMPTEAVLLPVHFEGLGDPGSLGIIIAALAAGSAVGAFGYGWLSRRMTRLTMMRIVLLGTALSIVPMALLPALPVMALAGFALGLCWGPFNPLMSTVVQRRVRPDEQGRVYGVQLSAFYAAPPIAMLAVGAAVEGYGVEATYLGLAVVLAATALVALLTPGLREIND